MAGRSVANKTRVTIRDVANAAGVSHTAVWAALSGKASNIAIGDKKRKLIEKVARELNYRPDMLAKSFTNKKSYLVGYLANKANEAFGLEVVEGIQLAAHSHDYAVVTFVSCSPENESANLQLCLDRRIDALIVNATVSAGKNNVARIRELVSSDVPVVEVFGDFIPGAVSANTDHQAVGRLATEHLLELGHKRIVHFTHEQYLDRDHPGSHCDALRIWEGHRDLMVSNDLQAVAITHALDHKAPLLDGFFASAYEAAGAVLDHPSKPTAVVCYNDYEALALLKACSERGLSVPQDLSVIGSLNVWAGSVSSPGLTTIGHCPKKVGTEAARLCFRIMDSQKVEDVLVAPELVLRSSTCSPHGA